MECFKCTKKGIDLKLIGEKCFSCEGCKRLLCEKCSGESFTATEIRVLQLKKDKQLTYFCGKCRKEMREKKEFESRIIEVVQESIIKFTDDIKESIGEMVKIKLGEFMKQCAYPAETDSYASRLKKVDSHALVIRPKAGNDRKGSETKEEVKRIIDPSDLGIGITKMRGVKDGGLAVCCESSDDTQRLKSDVEMKLGGEYEVKEVKKWKPRLKIIGIEDGISSEELKECISKQNSNIGDVNELEVKVVKKMRKGYMAIVEVDANLYRRMLDCGALKIKWKICAVFECLDIMRCFKCLGFNHRANDCKNVEGNKQVCSQCGIEGHKENECACDNLRCINCVRANERLGLKLNVRHGAFDKKCTTLTRQVERKRERIEYSK